MLQSMDNALNISNDDLIQQLRNYGIAVDERTVSKKRDILIKQLNHAIARNKQNSPPKSTQSLLQVGKTTAGSSQVSENVATSRVTRQSGVRPRSEVNVATSEPVLPPIPTTRATPKVPTPTKTPQSQVTYSTIQAPVFSDSFNTPGSSSSFNNFGYSSNRTPVYSPIRYDTPALLPVAKPPLTEQLRGFVENMTTPPLIYYILAVALCAAAIFLVGLNANRTVIPPKHQLANEQIQLGSSADRLLICDKTFKEPCFPEGVVKNCLPILPFIRSVLDAEFVKTRCGGSNSSEEIFHGLPIAETLSLAKAVAAGKNTPSPDEDALLSLIHANPHWRIQLVDKTGAIADVVDSAVALRTRNTKLPWPCRISIWAWAAASFLGRLFVVTACFVLLSGFLLACFWTIRGKLAHRRYLKEKSHELAEQIVEAVRQQYEAYNAQATTSTPPASGTSRIQPFVVIRHLADTLMPMDQRCALAPAWKAAVELIRTSESRIRSEVRLVDGEHVNVWLWTAGLATLSSAKRPTVKPPAATNRTPSPSKRNTPGTGTRDASPSSRGLTPCLKIRGVLSQRALSKPASTETLQEAQARIREAAVAMGGCGSRAILEVHIRRLNDGTVAIYVRCVDEVASGRLAAALRKLHTQVSVHYIHSDKFNEHFS